MDIFMSYDMSDEIVYKEESDNALHGARFELKKLKTNGN